MIQLLPACVKVIGIARFVGLFSFSLSAILFRLKFSCLDENEAVDFDASYFLPDGVVTL